ncbi:MAG: YceI family protein [Bacteroidota bacterium]
MRTPVVLLFLLVGMTIAVAQNLKLPNDKKASSITYSMNHPLHKWDGVSNEVNSILLTDAEKKKILQVAVKAKLASFDSKNANRDSHMIEVAEGLKFPDVAFSSSEITLTDEQFSTKGNLVFHGVTRPVVLNGTFKRKKDQLIFTGSFKVKMSDHGIEPPSLMGLATDDEFVVKFEVVY